MRLGFTVNVLFFHPKLSPWQNLRALGIYLGFHKFHSYTASGSSSHGQYKWCTVISWGCTANLSPFGWMHHIYVYAQVFCQQACTGIYRQAFLESLRLPRKVTGKNVRARGFLFPFLARSPYRGDLGRDVTLSLLSYPELRRGLTAYVPDKENIGISSCIEKNKGHNSLWMESSL